MEKTTVYLVRHAQAAGNLARTFQGHSDCALTDAGRRQLDCLARRFQGVSVNAIYSSPLRRALETAEAVNRGCGLTVTPEPGLIEVNGGKWEGMAWSAIQTTYPEAYRDWQEAPQRFEAPCGDRMTDVLDRITEAVLRLAQKHQGGTIVLASHACAIRNFMCFARGIGIEHLRDAQWDENTSVSLVEFDGEMCPTVLYQNDVSHLTPDLFTTQNITQ